MGVSIVRFEHDTKIGWGVLHDQVIEPLAGNYATHREVMDAYFQDPSELSTGAESISVSEVRYLSPVTNDVQIFCQGLNYASHRAEGGMTTEDEDENLLFLKPASSICGPNDDIVRPKGCELLDYEVELGVVMRADVPADTEINAGNLMDYVGGVTLTNDVSARDMMFGAPVLQWFRGKGQRTFCPTGPVLYLMDQDEIDLLDSLHLMLSWNGEVRQDATTDYIIHKPAKTLSELSSFTGVNKGDLLLTGTPGGVIFNMSPKLGLAIMLNMRDDKKRRAKIVASQKGVRYLQPGDELQLQLKSVDGRLDLGTQRNRIAG